MINPHARVEETSSDLYSSDEEEKREDDIPHPLPKRSKHRDGNDEAMKERREKIHERALALMNARNADKFKLVVMQHAPLGMSYETALKKMDPSTMMVYAFHYFQKDAFVGALLAGADMNGFYVDKEGRTARRIMLFAELFGPCKLRNRKHLFEDIIIMFKHALERTDLDLPCQPDLPGIIVEKKSKTVGYALTEIISSRAAFYRGSQFSKPDHSEFTSREFTFFMLKTLQGHTREIANKEK